MVRKAGSKWRPLFEKARGRLLLDKLMTGGGGGGQQGDVGAGARDGGGTIGTDDVKNNELILSL